MVLDLRQGPVDQATQCCCTGRCLALQLGTVLHEQLHHGQVPLACREQQRCDLNGCLSWSELVQLSNSWQITTGSGLVREINQKI